MNSLTFIGIGLNDIGKDLTVSGISLIKNADKAMYQSKQSGKNQYKMFSLL